MLRYNFFQLNLQEDKYHACTMNIPFTTDINYIILVALKWSCDLFFD